MNAVSIFFSRFLIRFGGKYQKNGHFNVSMGRKITEAAKVNNVPNEYGIYLIYEGLDCNAEWIYIVSCGTIQSDETMGNQGKRKRLGMKHNGGIYRSDFFKEEMEKRRMGISIAWYITVKIAGQKTLPALADSEAMQAFYELEGRLPELNKSF